MAHLAGKRLAFVGKLGGASLREARQIVRDEGGILVAPEDPQVDCLVLGEAELPIASSESQLDDRLLQAADAGRLEIWSETEFWERVGRLEAAPASRRYTAAMLAELLGLPVAVIRRWHRKGWLQPVEVVHRLAYFDFSQVAVARQLARLVADGMSPKSLERKLQQLARYLPAARQSLEQLSMIVEHGELLVRADRGLLGADGQWRFDFDRAGSEESSEDTAAPDVVSVTRSVRESGDEEAGEERSCREQAWEHEDRNELAEAVRWYRAALVEEGLQPDLCFQLAEVLYRIGDVGAARERYWVAVELDPDFVEARANLGCLLAECGEWEWAAAALEGALQTHPDYADAHFHLAEAYTHLERPTEAHRHWQHFLRLVPDGPWSDEARRRLENVIGPVQPS